MSHMRIRLRGDDGFVAGSDALIFGVLVFVCGTLLVTNLWSVIDSKIAAENAAMEAARAYVEARTADEALAAADTAAHDVLDRSRRGDEATVSLSTTDGFRRCSRVAVTVSREVTLLAIPLVGDIGGSMRVTGRHSELVDPYRSGETLRERAGNVDCDG